MTFERHLWVRRHRLYVEVNEVLTHAQAAVECCRRFVTFVRLRIDDLGVDISGDRPKLSNNCVCDSLPPAILGDCKVVYVDLVALLLELVDHIAN